MKKLFTLLLVSVLSIGAASAQDETTTVKTEKKKPKSGLEIEYLMYDDSNAVGANLVLGFLALGGEYVSDSDLAEGVSDSYTWRASAGINKRLYIVGPLYADLRLGAFYQSVNVKYDSDYSIYLESDKSTDESWGAYAYPRVGLNLFNNFAVTAGYKFNFNDFKFEGDYITSAFSVGIGFLF